MKYFAQIDPKLGKLFNSEFPPNSFKRFSCYFCSIANGVMLTSDNFFDDMDLFKIAREAVRKDFIDLDFFIRQPDGLVKLFSPDYYYIGYRSKSSKNVDKAIFGIECWVNDKYKHFRLAAFDPMEDTSRTVQHGTLTSYRLFGRVY